MTRINTNVSSLNAQKSLARTGVQLQEALTRLSTGLRINVGKDDPAGLIGSEVLRSDIVSTQKAISNSERANQMIATADSALGQVNSLLNDIRALITEAANSGAMSDEQIAANQLQIDSSLEAINRIAQTTSFQGRKLLDGNLDFIISAASGALATVSDLDVQQANLGAAGSMPVNVDITDAAAQAQITATIDDSPAPATLDIQVLGTGKDPDDPGTITLTATDNGEEYNGYTVRFNEVTGLGAANVFAQLHGTYIDIYVDDTADTDTGDIVTALGTNPEIAALFTATETAAGFYTPGAEDTEQGPTTGGDSGGLDADLVFQLSGMRGSQVFNFDAGTSGSAIRDAINLVSDATGVTADLAGTTLTLTSTDYGSAAFVAVSVISEGAGGTFESSLSADRATGEDIEATVNGVNATGKGNTLSISTATLAMSATVDDGDNTDFSFTITGGGALFQLGPDVVSNQQSRIGIKSLDTGNLGGPTGRLYEVGSGQAAALATDPTTAAAIVDEVITKVTALRGRLGAFQKTTIDSNVKSLTDTLENLTSAESSIRDADFAAETANLTRAQVLSQSGMAVLSIANSQPQNVLALLRNL
jgi:flagellin